MSTVHTPETSQAELQSALDFVKQKYNTNPTKMIMNRHTFHELAQIDNVCAEPVPEWAEIPIKLDETKDNHVIEFVMPELNPEESRNLETSLNESSVPVESVQS